MSTTALATEQITDYKVADITLADWGNKEIAIAETEMPALMASACKVRGPAAAGRRQDSRLYPHDHPDSGTDPDSGSTRC